MLDLKAGHPPAEPVNTSSPSTSAAPAGEDRFVELVSDLLDTATAAELFEILNRTAILPYEEVENSGTLILAPPDSEIPRRAVEFARPIELQNVRGIRKYLEIADGNLCLFSDCRLAMGLIPRSEIHPAWVTVRFRTGGRWEARLSGSPVLVVDAGVEPKRRPGLQPERLVRELAGVFPALSPIQIARLSELAAAATRQTNGANILISADAASEARRLSSQCTPVRPVRITPADLHRLTSIDGTVVIDLDGVCHAIGAILDGAVSSRGDRARGGRYNSAVMYLDSVRAASLIIVVSRDATVDILSSRSSQNVV